MHSTKHTMTQAKKIALITGGSRGLGKNMALRLAQNGVNLILTYHTGKQQALDTIQEIEQSGVRAAALQLNVGSTQKLDPFFADLKAILQGTFATDKIDFLINNAGIGIHAAFADTTEEQFDSLLNIHFRSVFFLTQKALPILADGGAIINVSTGLARFSLPGYAAYAAMKGAIETLTRYLAKELGSRGIRANTIAPGAIETDFSGGVVRDNTQLNQYIASQTALGRVGLPDDVGGVVAFLCSDAARWVTAQRIEISGGQML
jgi:NAD(P)-dependent dehydrogenase (short-subunit alcohol dehydrogenase family)